MDKSGVIQMPSLSFMDSLRQKWKRSIPSNILKTGPLLNVGEGEQIVLTYTSAADKMKIIAAFISEGLRNGDLVDYSFPDKERETVRAKLKEHGINVEKHEEKGALILDSLTEYYLENGKFDKNSLISKGLDERFQARRKGYKHYRSVDDLGDFSFLNGQWQEFIDYWDDPYWATSSSTEKELLDYSPFVTELVAFNIEEIDETQLAEMQKAFWMGKPSSTAFIDLLEYTNAFSKLLGIPHEKLIGRKLLLEFDPASNYEKAIENLTKEAIANVYPIFIVTSAKSSLHTHLVTQSQARFFLLSTFVSKPESTSKNEILLPFGNLDLILDSLNKVLEENENTNTFLVFDKISEIINLIGFSKTYKFLSHVSEMLFQTKTTALFLLNTSAHEPQTLSQIRARFPNLLTYNKDGLRIEKIS